MLSSLSAKILSLWLVLKNISNSFMTSKYEKGTKLKFWFRSDFEGTNGFVAIVSLEKDKDGVWIESTNEGGFGSKSKSKPQWRKIVLSPDLDLIHTNCTFSSQNSIFLPPAANHFLFAIPKLSCSTQFQAMTHPVETLNAFLQHSLLQI